MSRGDASATEQEAPLPGWVVPVALAGVAGVVAYVAAWALAGALTTDYDPVRQAISELFAIGAPAGPAALVSVTLVVTGLLLVALGAALHLGLPGRGLTGPVLTALAGVTTAAVVVFPCTAGCPGIGVTVTDTMHTLVAGAGYAAFVTAPLFFARRLRGHDDVLAGLSVVLGSVAAVGFLLRALGVGSDMSGLTQRVFNTTADAWYVLAALAAVRYARAGHGASPRAGRD